MIRRARAASALLPLLGALALGACTSRREPPAPPLRPEPVRAGPSAPTGDSAGEHAARVAPAPSTIDAAAAALADPANEMPRADVDAGTGVPRSRPIALRELTSPPREELDPRTGEFRRDPNDYAHALVGYHEALGLIPLPPPSPELLPEVARLRPVALRGARCWEQGGRASNTAPPDCPALAEQLVRAGPAAAHAVGRLLIDVQLGQLLQREQLLGAVRASWYDGSTFVQPPGIVHTAPFYTAVLRRLNEPAAVPYLIDYLSYALDPSSRYVDWGSAAAMRAYFEVLPALTDNDLTPMAPWAEPEQAELGEWLARRVAVWLRWYRAHAAEPRTAWREQGLERARAALDGADPLARLAGVLRLGARGNTDADRQRATTTLARVVASRRLGVVGRRYLTNWAREQGLEVATAPTGDAGAPSDAAAR